MDIGVRELKQHLSEYLDRAHGGEIIRVTERGTPKVQLGPLPAAGAVDEGIAAGWLRPATRPGGLIRDVVRYSAERRTSDVLSDDRVE